MARNNVERFGCFLCEKTFGSIEALEVHEARRHPPDPCPPADDFQARENAATLEERARTDALRADLTALAETLSRVEALASDLGRTDLALWARGEHETARRWAERI